MSNGYLNIHRIVRLKYKHPFESDFHAHKFYHYVYILKGTGIIKIINKEYLANKEEFYLIPPGKYHLIKTYDNKIFNTIEIKFILNNTELAKTIQSLPNFIKINHDIPVMLDSILNEAVEKEIFYKEVINSKFSEIIYKLLRFLKTKSAQECKKEKLSITNLPKNKRMCNIEKFIENNLHYNITIDQLAEVANLSKTHFSSIFKEVYGLTPMDYINRSKYIEAKKLLDQYPDFNISQTSQSLGFSSVHYFSRFFKKMEGVSPSKYINETNINLRINIH